MNIICKNGIIYHQINNQLIKRTNCVELNIELCADCFMRSKLKPPEYACSEGCRVMLHIGNIACKDESDSQHQLHNLYYANAGAFSLKEKFAHVVRYENIIHLRKALELAFPEYLLLLEEVMNEK